jgi:hypothetical protein
VDWFTTAYFHHPAELRSEVEEAGLAFHGLFGIEGAASLVGHLWDDPKDREHLLRVARTIEQEPTLLGLSAHLLAVARSKPRSQRRTSRNT